MISCHTQDLLNSPESIDNLPFVLNNTLKSKATVNITPKETGFNLVLKNSLIIIRKTRRHPP